MTETRCSCGSKPVYFRRYEGRHYCRECFSKQIEKRFLKTVHENNLFAKDEKVAVALSGGKDSSVLLHLMKKFFSHVDVCAISVDEGIRGYRSKGLMSAGKLCKSLSAGHHRVSFEKELKLTLDGIKTDNFCTYCGVFRRHVLNKAARKIRADKIAVGHNMDDEVQSILMNVLRGDVKNFRRLGPKPPSLGDEKLVPRIKPLRDIPEKEVKLYALLNKIPHHDGECPHSLNNVRRDVQKTINDTEEKYPGTKFQIISFYDKINPMIRPEISLKGAGQCKTCGEASAAGTCRACELSGKAAAKRIDKKRRPASTKR